MRRHLLLCVLWLWLIPLTASADEGACQVKEVTDGHTLLLTNGKNLLLTGIYTPFLSYLQPNSSEPLAEEAKRTLEQLISGHEVTVQPLAAPHDRHGRLIGQAYAGKTWLQAAMLREGMALVYSIADIPNELLPEMLAQEQQARSAKRGIWAIPYFSIITPEQAAQQLNHFRIVEGKVVSVHNAHGNIYINFFADWHGRFAVFISRKQADRFVSLPILESKTIRVRGWIHYHNAPTMDISHPNAIEIIP